jgi:hypothetical protein
MLGLNTLGRAVRQLAGTLTRLSQTLEEANTGLRRRLALDVVHQSPEPVASLPGPANSIAAEPVQPVAPSKRNGKARSV